MDGTLYFHNQSNSRSWSWKLLSPLYAEIVLDLQARELKDRLFTYRVPEYLAEDVFVGAQVLVPFGHQETVAGYVVSLLNETNVDFKLKDISEVVELDPLFDKQYIDFLGWLAFKSCAGLSDVIQAAIPASLAPRVKRMVQLKDNLGIEEFLSIKDVLSKKDQASAGMLSVLIESREQALSFNTLKQRFKRASRTSLAHFHRALRFLKQEGLLEVVAESPEVTSPKKITSVLRLEEEPKTPRQREIVALLERHKGTMPLSDLLKIARTTYGTIHKMRELGVVALTEVEVIRDPMKSFSTCDFDAESIHKPRLTAHQSEVMAVLSRELKSMLENNDREKQVLPWLLHGVTGSGKTEIYLRLIEEALSLKRTALLLVPEISLTPQLASRLKNRFGERVSIWHSAISTGERYDTWRRLRSGDVQVLLGARSAVLANIPNLGIIILDEEHDGSYKQTSPSPRYNAKEVALEKARRHGAMVLFGSATPDLVTYHKARQHSTILELPERVYKQPMPDVRIVDMRQELIQGNRSILSLPMQKAIGERLESGEQTILLINRRGYASHVFCRACGHVARCKHCSVSLVYHKTSSLSSGRLRTPGQPVNDTRSVNASPKSAGSIQIRTATGGVVSVGSNIAGYGYLSCHHCGYERSMLKTCPECHSPFIKEYGLGTQQVEETVGQMFPSARIVRLDSDVAARKGAYKDVFEQFSQGRADILIGTQMVAKGLDVANVTLVGVLVADAALNMPDYRAQERGFQLLSQVAGRAGRGEKPGAVILQTYNPNLEVLQWAKNHDFQSFCTFELTCRQAFSYPPFSRIIRLVMQGLDAQEVEIQCERLAEEISVYLEDKMPEKAIQILGPSPCIIERVKNKYRYHLLIKVKETAENARESSEDWRSQPLLDHLLYYLRNKKTPKQLSLAVDVDALDLL